MTDSYNQTSINLASQSSAGDSIHISSLAQLNTIAPADPSGVRTLDIPNRCVIFDAAITLPDGERIVLGNSTILKGCDADIAGLLGNVDDALVSGSGDGIVVSDLFLRNFSAGPDAFCVYVTNGANPAGRASRVDRVSVGGRLGILIENAAAVNINILSRATEQGVVLRGTTIGTQLIDCVFGGDPTQPVTPVHVDIEPGLHSALRIMGCAFTLTTGSTGIMVSGAPTLELIQVSSNAFIPAGTPPGTPVDPATLPDQQADVFFTGNAGTADSTFGGSAGYNGNPTAETTTISVVGTILPGGEVTGAVRVGAGNLANPAFVLNPASARVTLDQPAGAESAVLRWAAIESANVAVSAAISVRSADALAKAIAGQIVRVPAAGPPTFVAAFTGVTGGLILAAGFIQPEGGISAIPPGDGIAIEVANLTDTVDLIIDSVDLVMRSVD